MNAKLVESGYLVTFSHTRSSNRRVPADRVYDELKKVGLWYVRRNTKLSSGARIFFYCNGVGVIGCGLVKDSTAITEADSSIIEHLGLEGFRTRILVEQWKTFAKPLNLREVVNELHFIRDKRNWGGSLQTSPVRIPACDVETLLSAAEPDELQR